jgi:hypothetical protein
MAPINSRHEAIKRRGVDAKSKETAVLTLWEGERRPPWLFASENEGGERVGGRISEFCKKIY